MAVGITRVTLIVLADGDDDDPPSGVDYRALLSMLLPRGKAWTREVSSVLQRLLGGVAMTFDRAHSRANQLLLEMDPRTADETIEDWERITQPYGTGDVPVDLADRQVAVTNIIVSRGGWAGGPSVTFFVSLASGLGFTLTIRRFHRRPFKCTSKCTDNLNTASAGWFFVWEFVALSLGAEKDALLQSQIERYAEAHLALTFAFPLLDSAAATFVRASVAVLTDPSSGTATALASGQRGELYHGV
jgi:uncharacterized protein YmfQ (DUF2313 family)